VDVAANILLLVDATVIVPFDVKHDQLYVPGRLFLVVQLIPSGLVELKAFVPVMFNETKLLPVHATGAELNATIGRLR
jgi:hypothetical protein